MGVVEKDQNTYALLMQVNKNWIQYWQIETTRSLIFEQGSSLSDK